MAKDAALEITQKFIDAIEGGMLEGKWVRPWDQLGELPHNALTKKDYNGINALILMMAGNSTFATYKQWSELGCQVRKGSKGHGILVPMLSKKDANGDQRLFGWKGATVFGSDQVDGYTAPVIPEREFTPIEAAEQVAANLGVQINHGGDRAFYVPSQDYISMPEREQFHSEEDYYATLMHEGAHSTGHSTRLNRDLNTGRFGDEAYAFEELVAELTASFVCADLSIHQGFRENHAKYLKSWVKVLKNDSTAIMTAASQAQRARTWMLKPETRVQPVAEAA